MKHSQKFLQQRKFVMALPLLVLPFLTLIFWALGGGKGTPAQAMSIEKTGLNLELPSAHFNDEEWNKLSLYESAERDSRKYKEEQENDPYFNLAALGVDAIRNDQDTARNQNKSTVSGSHRIPFSRIQNEIIDPNEANVNQKLDQLYRELNRNQELSTESIQKEPSNANVADPQFSSDVKELEKMMEMMKDGNQADPEMKQIESVLDKILEIQYPDRVRAKIKDQSEQNKGQVFPVAVLRGDENISLILPAKEINQIPMDNSALPSRAFSAKAQQNSFHGLNDEEQNEQQSGNAVEAVVHDTQELVAGSTVKMRLLNDVYINGMLIPKNQFVYGTTAIVGERLTIAINSIRDDNSLFPVSLSAYDHDGIEGIYIPGAITRDVAKKSSDQAMQGMQFLSMDQSLSAQAASAGLQAAKGLFSSKIKMTKVTVKSGYKILLKDGNNRL